MTRLRGFLAELKRRRVYQVAAVYAATAFVTVQAADLFLPRLGFPDWAVTLVAVLAVAGFPAALVLSWAFDITPRGLERTGPAPEGAAPVQPGTWRLVGGGAAGVVILAAGGWWLSTLAFGPAAPIDRLAVLPLANLMNDPEQEYFVQGMHDALISELAQAGVSVIARTSVLRYRDTDVPVREIARELGVGGVIEGSVLRGGDSVRIQVQLIDGATEGHLWAKTYDAELGSVLALHRQVTRDVAREIRSTLTPQAAARLAAAARPVNPEAYEAYLKGRFHWFRLTPRDIEAAMRYFELALEEDPDYALAYAGMAYAWAARAQMGVQRPHEAYREARAAARRALELDEGLGEAHATLAAVHTWYEYDWPSAEREFRRALELNPNDAHAHAFYGLFLAQLGRAEEARARIFHALELDPLNPYFQFQYGLQVLWERKFEETVAQLRRALEVDPNNHSAVGALAGALHEMGRLEESLAQRKNLMSLRGDLAGVEALERGYAEGGYEAAIRELAEYWVSRSRETYVNAALIAGPYATLGEVDLALEWLEWGYEERQGQLPFIYVGPAYDPLREDPRFQDLLRRMNFPDEPANGGVGSRPADGPPSPSSPGQKW